MDIKIRPARPEDVGVLTELSMRSKRSNGYDEAFMAACRKELTVTDEHLHTAAYAGDHEDHGAMEGAGSARMAPKKQCVDNHLAPTGCGERRSLYLALLKRKGEIFFSQR